MDGNQLGTNCGMFWKVMRSKLQQKKLWIQIETFPKVMGPKLQQKKLWGQIETFVKIMRPKCTLVPFKWLEMCWVNLNIIKHLIKRQFCHKIKWILHATTQETKRHTKTQKKKPTQETLSDFSLCEKKRLRQPMVTISVSISNSISEELVRSFNGNNTPNDNNFSFNLNFNFKFYFGGASGSG